MDLNKMTFEAVFGEAGSFKKILDAIGEVLDDVTLLCTKSGVDMQAMDSSKAILGVLKIDKSAFEHFHCEGQMKLGINLDSIKKVMKCISNKAKLTMKANEDSNVVTLKAEEKGNGMSTSEHDLKLLDLEDERLLAAVDTYTCVIEMPSSAFATLIKNLSTIGETTKVASNKSGVMFKANGDFANSTFQINATADIKVKLLGHLPELSFSTRFLAKCAKAATICDRVILSIDPEIPMALEYKVYSACGYLRYYLAPKMEDGAL